MGTVHVLTTETLDRSLKHSSKDPLDLCHDSGFTRIYEREDGEMKQHISARYLHQERGDEDRHFLFLDVLTQAPLDFYATYPTGKTKILKHCVPLERFVLDLSFNERELFGQQARLVCYKNLPIKPNEVLYDAFELIFDSSGTLSKVQVQSNSPRHSYSSQQYDSLVKKGTGQALKYYRSKEMSEVVKGVSSLDLCSRTLDAQATLQGLLYTVKHDEQMILEKILKFDK